MEYWIMLAGALVIVAGAVVNWRWMVRLHQRQEDLDSLAKSLELRDRLLCTWAAQLRRRAKVEEYNGARDLWA